MDNVRNAYGFLLKPLGEALYESGMTRPNRILAVPPSTEVKIEELCAQIRHLCCERLSPESEAELRHLARELRLAIRQHVKLAKSSLSIKQSAIVERDPERQ